MKGGGLLLDLACKAFDYSHGECIDGMIDSW